jgi:hypothetical protein
MQTKPMAQKPQKSAIQTRQDTYSYLGVTRARVREGDRKTRPVVSWRVWQSRHLEGTHP